MNDQKRQHDMGAYVRQLVELDKSAVPPDGGARFNRLIFSGSPYLLQHAENPVDWFPWGEEAFARARAEEKPVFLSIGYATCHWCHVMAHESFEDQDVAAVMNGNFVAIKVDREERPDIDDQYMTVSRLMTGSGGWPLNVFLTSDKRPFLTVTYLPKRGRSGMPGFIDLLENIAALWRSGRDRVEKNCADVMDALRQAVTAIPERGEGADLSGAAYRQLDAMYDPTWGGMGSAPKFPMPGNLSFLLRFWHRSGNPRPRAMVEHTLRMMRQGGIWDQVGGGFHRYSVDREWLVPHFEKMLYDQALVATAALEAGQATGDTFFATMAQEIFVFVKREMTSPDGGFYAGLDADSEGEEGRYYVWTPAEIREILGDKDAELFSRLFGVTEPGNFEGCSILFLPLPLEEFATREGIVPEIMQGDLERWRMLLLAEREKRIRPFRDEKVVTAWNGLMIAALAKGYAVTGEESYRTAAEECVRFILQRLQTPEGRLLRSSHRGAATVPAFLEDYAFLVHGLIGLYETTLDPARLDDALRLTLEMLRLFGEKDEGGLYDTGIDAEEVLLRTKSADDGVLPSGNSVAALNLLRLGRITADDGLVREGELLLRAFMGSAARQPAGYLYLLTALDYFTAPVVEVTLVGRREAPETTAMLRAIGRRFIPGLVLRFAGEGVKEGLATIEGKTAAYVCAKGACRPPVAGVGELEKLLDEAS